jgi:hypothetical protein
MTERGEAPSKRATDVARANDTNIHLCSFSNKFNHRGHRERRQEADGSILDFELRISDCEILLTSAFGTDQASIDVLIRVHPRMLLFPNLKLGT